MWEELCVAVAAEVLAEGNSSGTLDLVEKELLPLVEELGFVVAAEESEWLVFDSDQLVVLKIEARIIFQ